MDPDQQARLSDIRRAMIMTQIQGVPGTLMIAAGLYGLFGNNPPALLANPINCYGLLALGGLIGLWEGLKIIKLNKQRRQLEREFSGD